MSAGNVTWHFPGSDFSNPSPWGSYWYLWMLLTPVGFPQKQLIPFGDSFNPQLFVKSSQSPVCCPVKWPLRSKPVLLSYFTEKGFSPAWVFLMLNVFLHLGHLQIFLWNVLTRWEEWATGFLSLHPQGFFRISRVGCSLIQQKQATSDGFPSGTSLGGFPV